MNAAAAGPSSLNSGHRQRLRERLFNSGPEAMPDYELLELLLCSAIPRRDVKPLAKNLLNEFGDLWTLLNTKPDRLLAHGLSEAVVASLLAAGAVALRAHKCKIMGQPLLQNWQQIIDYCRAAMGCETKELFRLLFINQKNMLLADEVQQRGTINHTPVYPREIVQRALELGATAIILVHNHPSGDPSPSKEDIAMTRAVANACQALSITVFDHIIVGRGGTIASFKSLGLI